METPIIELKKAGFSAQSDAIVQEISIAFKTGAATALAGPSGCGKSTVLKLSAGLLVPSSGEVLYKGRNISGMNRAQDMEFRREGAVVFQDAALWANQDIYSILNLPLRVHFPTMNHTERENRIREVCAEVGYTRSLQFRPAKLSMGEQKLIAFARAMLCKPPLLFLDEWTESLDDDAAGRLVGIVRRLKAEGRTIIFVSHDLRLIESLADYVIMIKEGRISLSVTGEQITEDSTTANLVQREIDQCDLEYALSIR